MQKKMSHSDISLYIMPVFKSILKKCNACNKKIDNHKKMIVFNELYIPVGYSCKYCNTIYDETDSLVDIGNPDKVDIYGKA